MNVMDGNEKVANALAEQTFAERIEMAAVIVRLITDHYGDNTEIPDVDAVAHWLENVSNLFLPE